ncbi:hypothetical protein [Mycolicibacillus trivialis]|uniref:hypothetical protein n=1 Tax=Mycolicibacillus trivialis TaxID=1798 RepID=UPI00105463A0|nr:hypothetical protein [Mycolicibacillus trivialis]
MTGSSAEVFISYKHAKYVAEARALAFALERQYMLTCFFDQRDSLWNVSDNDLRVYLSAKLKLAQVIAFFETYSEQVAAIELSTGGQPRVVDSGNRPSWQEWELTQADASRYLTLYHSAIPQTLQLGLTGDVVVYDNISVAAEHIVSYLGRKYLADATE